MSVGAARRVLLILGCVLALAAAPRRASADVSAASAAVQAEIAAAVEKERAVYGGKTPVPGVLVGVWDGSGGSYVHAFGDADIATVRRLTPADHFRIGSNTKTFVVSALLQLVDEGKLSLDDPPSRFSLGVTVPNAEHITVRELCQMRSGLFEAYDAPEFDHLRLTPNMAFDPRTAIGWAVRQKPYFAPGAGYRYSNTNYLLLGLIIESVTKESVGEQIRKRLLEPFRLTQTFYP
ncbi:MAG: beta-lactamase family protein, partial [Acetobacteraceae bacterium]|nr:beta-lactamase family protein [Acetobacteraceae bacterium]